MRIAAALILTFASSVALADFNDDAGVSIFDFGTFAAKGVDADQAGVDRTRQPISGYQGEVIEYQDGDDYSRSPSPQVDGSDFLIWQRGILDVPEYLDIKEDEEGGM